MALPSSLNLLAGFDTRKINTVELINPKIQSYSIPTHAEIGDIVLDDWGKTMNDIGIVATPEVGFRFDSIMKIDKNKRDMDMHYVLREGVITSTVDTKAGAYLSIANGAYLTGFFKLEEYPYEIFPARFGRGLVIEMNTLTTQETFDEINNINDGYFLYMGVRAENKFSALNPLFLGLKTSERINLGPDHEEEPEEGINGNVLGFRFTGDKKLSYCYIDDDGEVVFGVSENEMTTPGWKCITVQFIPCDDIEDPDLLDCSPRRYGVLRVFINGNLFWEVQNFPEPMFKGLDTHRTKQIGVPYNIGWGGGTNGLSESTDSLDNIITPAPSNRLAYLFGGTTNVGIQYLRIYEGKLNQIAVRTRYNQAAYEFGLKPVKSGRIRAQIAW